MLLDPRLRGRPLCVPGVEQIVADARAATALARTRVGAFGRGERAPPRGRGGAAGRKRRRGKRSERRRLR